MMRDFWDFINSKIIYQKIEFLSGWIVKHVSDYMDWLTVKLAGQSSFGLLSLVSFSIMFFVLIYVFIRSDRDTIG